MRRILTAAALFAAILPTLSADDRPMNRVDADAAAAMALAKAKRRTPAIVAQTKPIPYTEAKALAVKANKPVFISVGLPCQGLCQHLRDAGFVTVHESSFLGSREPRAILAVPAKGDLYFGKQWSTLPAEAEIKQALIDWRKQNPGLGPLSRAELQEAASLLVTSSLAILPADWTEVNADTQIVYRTVCGPNGCQEVPVGYQRMPLGEGGQVAYAPDGVATDGQEGEFVATFPRIAGIRGRARRFVGRLLHREVRQPRYRGEYRVGNQSALPGANVLGGVTGATGGRLGLFERHPLVRLVSAHYLAKLASEPGLTAEQAEAIRLIQSNPAAFDHFVRGLPKAASGGKGPPIEASGNVLDFVKWLLTAAFTNREAILQFIMEIVKLFHATLYAPPIGGRAFWLIV